MTDTQEPRPIRRIFLNGSPERALALTPRLAQIREQYAGETLIIRGSMKNIPALFNSGVADGFEAFSLIKLIRFDNAGQPVERGRERVMGEVSLVSEKPDAFTGKPLWTVSPYEEAVARSRLSSEFIAWEEPILGFSCEMLNQELISALVNAGWRNLMFFHGPRESKCRCLLRAKNDPRVVTIHASLRETAALLKHCWLLTGNRPLLRMLATALSIPRLDVPRVPDSFIKEMRETLLREHPELPRAEDV